MIIRAKQEGNTVVLHLEGHLDFETIIQFEKTCQQVKPHGEATRLIVNMEALRFVGSSGISQFVNVLKSINHKECKPKLVQVSSDFEKILRALQNSRNPFDIFETEAQGISAFDMPPPPPTSPPSKNKKGHA